MNERTGPRPHQPAYWALRLIRLYQRVLSPSLGRNCRYLPTCSRYAYDAISEHGLLRGGGMAATRIARCNPWGGTGYDPVPPRRQPVGGSR